MAQGIVYRTAAMEMVPRTRVITDVSAFYGIANVDPIAFGADTKAGEIYNLLSTVVGDEPFLPTFGCDLPLRTFEPITGKLLSELMLDVFVSTRTFIPEARVSIGRCKAIALPANRLAGIVVAYQFGGVAWHLPVNLAGNALNGAYGS